jgi:hypothetical protein
MLNQVSIKFHPEEAVPRLKETHGSFDRLSGRRRHGFKTDQRHIRSNGNEVQLFESNDVSSVVFHQDDIIAGFFADMFLIRVSEPHRERVSDRVEE